MRKPLVALGLAIAGIGALPAADVLAASTASKTQGTNTTATSPIKAPNSVSGGAIVQTALKYVGYPYTTTGNSPSTGFSCIGFVSFVYRSNGISLPGDLGGAIAYAPRVPFANLQPGDILYFANTVWSGLSHAAIYLGGGRFIHAEWYNKGVRISSFNNDKLDGNYWIAHYLGANRPWGGAAVAPVIGTPSGPPTAPTVGTTTVTGGNQATVTVSSLNVRSGPGMNDAVQTVLPQGASLTIIGKSNGWYKVQLPDGRIGWVIASGIGKGSAAPVPATATNPNIGTPTAPTRTGIPTPPAVHRATAASSVAGLRVHSSPSVNAPVVTGLARGQRFTVLARSNGWIKIRTYTDYVGWVKASLTSASRTSSATTTTSTSNTVVNTRTPAKTTTRSTAYTTGPVVTTGVRLHSAPGLKTPVIGGVAAGTHVKVLGSSGGWDLVRLPSGQTGYVYSSYVR